MAGINGSVDWGIVPLDWHSSNLGTMAWNYYANYLKSANDQLRYQVIWTNGTLNEGVEPSAGNAVVNVSGVTTAGDVVNAIFTVKTSVDGSNWDTIGVIKKSRDIANRKYNDGTPAANHRFTIDISQLVSDQLSYSLCPINKGTWQSNLYGGMNGGAVMQDNVIGASPVSNYNVSDNGTFRRIKVTANFDIINADGEIETATNSLGSSPNITAINSVNQFEKDSTYYNTSFNIRDSSTRKYQCLTRSPNINSSFKQVRIDEQAEFLQFYVDKAASVDIGGSGNNEVASMALMIETVENNSVVDTFYLRDFEDNLITSLTSGTIKYLSNEQNSMCVQNISPSYINNSGNVWLPNDSRLIADFPYWTSYSGDKILSTTEWYRVSVVKVSLFGAAPQSVRRVGEYYFYDIDRENENIPYGFVRFHWLNSMGGIDSYTAKRDVVEGLTISRDVVERKSGDRTWYQDNSNAGTTLDPSVYISDTMRGGDIYKGGREVSGVNADRVQSVYTEPLNKSVAKWLEEMLLSPNVWIEQDTDATEKGNLSNPYLRPSTKGYIPVIITNSDAETVNQSNGLVKFNIEYTLAHKVQTQRN
jgi:hypothetical protein